MALLTGRDQINFESYSTLARGNKLSTEKSVDTNMDTPKKVHVQLSHAHYFPRAFAMPACDSSHKAQAVEDFCPHYI